MPASGPAEAAERDPGPRPWGWLGASRRSRASWGFSGVLPGCYVQLAALALKRRKRWAKRPTPPSWWIAVGRLV
jgi:hypothetical protein